MGELAVLFSELFLVWETQTLPRDSIGTELSGFKSVLEPLPRIELLAGVTTICDACSRMCWCPQALQASGSKSKSSFSLNKSSCGNLSAAF